MINENSVLRFKSKTYGRIFVTKSEDIEKVEKIIEEIEEFEYNFLPKSFIKVWNGNINDLMYTHKFEIDILKLTEACWNKNIIILCINVNNINFGL